MVVVSIKTFRVLFSLCKKGNLVEEALELLVLITEFNWIPDIITYNIVIHLPCETGHMESGKVMLHQALELGLSPDFITFSSLVKEFKILGQLDYAQSLVDEMKVYEKVLRTVFSLKWNIHYNSIKLHDLVVNSGLILNSKESKRWQQR